MSKRKRQIVFLVGVPATLAIVFVAFNQRQPRLATASVGSVISQIKDMLEADPNYISLDSFVVPADDPNRIVPLAFSDYLNLRLQVIVRGSNSIVMTNPRWHIQLGRLLRQLPSLLGFSRKRDLWYVRRVVDCQGIEIHVLEPTDEEMERLQGQVKSLRCTHNIPIEFSAYFPDR